MYTTFVPSFVRLQIWDSTRELITHKMCSNGAEKVMFLKKSTLPEDFFFPEIFGNADDKK